MYKDTARWIKACAKCARRKPPRPLRQGKTKPMGVQRPLQRISIDFLGPFPETKEGHTHLLTVMDNFTRYPWAFPMRERDSGKIAAMLIEKIALKYGPPEWIFSDREPGFASAAMRSIMQRFGTKVATTTGEQPQANAFIERVHSFMAQNLTMLVDRHKTDWDKWIESVLFMYRIAPHDVHGFTPFYMMFGRQARLPAEVMLGFDAETGHKDEAEYALKLSEALTEAYTSARRQQGRRERQRAKKRDKSLKLTEDTNAFPKGGWVMFWERPPRPKQSEEAPKIPQKLENRYSGPTEYCT